MNLARHIPEFEFFVYLFLLFLIFKDTLFKYYSYIINILTGVPVYPHGFRLRTDCVCGVVRHEFCAAVTSRIWAQQAHM